MICRSPFSTVQYFSEIRSHSGPPERASIRYDITASSLNLAQISKSKVEVRRPPKPTSNYKGQRQPTVASSHLTFVSANKLHLNTPLRLHPAAKQINVLHLPETKYLSIPATNIATCKPCLKGERATDTHQHVSEKMKACVKALKARLCHYRGGSLLYLYLNVHPLKIWATATRGLSQYRDGKQGKTAWYN